MPPRRSSPAAPRRSSVSSFSSWSSSVSHNGAGPPPIKPLVPKSEYTPEQTSADDPDRSFVGDGRARGRPAVAGRERGALSLSGPRLAPERYLIFYARLLRRTLAGRRGECIRIEIRARRAHSSCLPALGGPGPSRTAEPSFATRHSAIVCVPRNRHAASGDMPPGSPHHAHRCAPATPRSRSWPSSAAAPAIRARPR